MVKRLIKYWYLIIILVVIAGGLIYFQQSSVARVKSAKSLVVKKQSLKEILSLSGEIDANEKATLRFQTSGLLAWVGVKEGDYVKKYQGIASLDKRELEKNMKKYLNTFKQSRFDLDQTREDYEDKAITDAMQRIIDNDQLDLDNAVLDVELKDIALKYAYLYTPIEGLVVKADVPQAGINITPAGAEFVVINPQSIYFSVNVDQTDIVQLKDGMTGEIILDAYPEEEFTGTIQSIGFTPKTGETGTVYQVKINFNGNNDQYQYRIGMTGDMNFVLKEKKSVIAVPTTYLKTEKGKKYVYVDNNGQKEKTFIRIGEEIDGSTVVTSGLKEGDLIYD